MMESKAPPSYDELAARYETLQKRVTRFSVVEQKLIDTRNDLDLELERFKGLARYNHQALTVQEPDELAILTVETISEVLQLECVGLFFVEPERQHCRAAAFCGFKRLDKSFIVPIAWLAEHDLAEPPATNPLLKTCEAADLWFEVGLDRLILAPFFAHRRESLEGFIIGGNSRQNKDFYPEIDASLAPAFSVMTQQVALLFAHLWTYQDLEATVARRTAELRKANAQLERKNRQLEDEIHERESVETALRVSEERYHLAAEGANDGIWDWDLREGRVFYSARWKDILGYAPDEIGDSPKEWFDRVSPVDAHRVRAELDAHLASDAQHLSLEHAILHKDGSLRWVLCRGYALRHQGEVLRIAGSLTDLTERRRWEEKLEREALYDKLTDLPNRKVFMDRLGRAFVRGRRSGNPAFSVMFIDIDHFKTINDTYGHPIGDLILKEIALRLSKAIRQVDTVARIGGDEFVVLLDDASSNDQVIPVAERIMATCRQPVETTGGEICPSLSIGVASACIHHKDGDEVIRDADVALYRAKSLGRGRYEIFEASKAHAMRRASGSAQKAHPVPAAARKPIH